jgi:hypothetical protein
MPFRARFTVRRGEMDRVSPSSPNPVAAKLATFQPKVLST